MTSTDTAVAWDLAPSDMSLGFAPHVRYTVGTPTHRDRFLILEHTTSVINHSLGGMPADAERRVLDVGNRRDPDRRGGTITVRVPHSDAVHREFGKRQILSGFRPDAGLRLRPHYFTSDDELRFAVDQVVEMESGAYDRHRDVAARF